MGAWEGSSKEPAKAAKLASPSLAPDAPRPADGPSSHAVSAATRHVMQANRSKDTKPELLVRAGLRERGLTGYRKQYRRAAGRPDVAFPGRRVAIFVNGCFWHRCPYCHPSQPHTNRAFWDAKFARNRERDRRNAAELVEGGWTVVVVWECRLKGPRARRTISDVACEVRLRAGGGAPVRAGRVLVAGNGLMCRERAIRALRERARDHRGDPCRHRRRLRRRAGARR